MLGFIEKAEKWSARIFVLTGALCLVGIVAAIALNVVLRFVFNAPLMWYLELCSVFVVWLAFIPLGANYLLERHFVIDTFIHYLPERFRPVQRLIVDAICLAVVILLAVSAMDAIDINGDMQLNTIPVSLAIASYLPVVVGAVSHTVLIATKYIKLALSRRNERTAT